MMTEGENLRAGLFVDGFNLYHAIHDLGANHLKWLNLQALGQKIIQQKSETLAEVVYCTAYYPGDPDKRRRHELYIRALAHHGVETKLGHYIHEPMACRSCDHVWEKPTEKQTDINLALSMVDAVRSGRVDCIYLLTADTDQAATLAYLQTHFPSIQRVTVFPPGRHPSDDLKKRSNRTIKLQRHHIEENLLLGFIAANPGIVRPVEYDP